MSPQDTKGYVATESRFVRNRGKKQPHGFGIGCEAYFTCLPAHLKALSLADRLPERISASDLITENGKLC